MSGYVWLVGAGPGDAGLLTVKGRSVLENAEVVIYDSLVSDSILALIPETAESIDAGKRAGNHKLRQEETNELLLCKALEGRRVVRLKGGDPFLFGRGGEELDLLQANGIPYEVVPGVTSAIAVPAYSGIPVTHRDLCSSVHIITGHRKRGESLDLDFEALAKTKGTLVFLMGVSSLREILSGLAAAGMDPRLPAAVIREGTTARQTCVSASLGTLADESQKAGITPPAVIVVGEVAKLAEKYRWYELLPLFGLRVLLTRPKELISEMAELLRAEGAEVIELPAIRTVPIRRNAALYQALKRLGEYQWIAFTSPSGVRIFMEEMERSGTDIRALAHIKVAALGEGTKRELRKHGIFADLVPDTYDVDSLGSALAAAAKPGDAILIPRASNGNPVILERLKAFRVEDVPTYDTLPCANGVIPLKERFAEGMIDCAVFTSSSGVRAFAEQDPDLDFGSVTAICIGTKTRECAERYGMRTRMAKEATLESLLQAVRDYRKERDGRR